MRLVEALSIVPFENLRRFLRTISGVWRSPHNNVSRPMLTRGYLLEIRNSRKLRTLGGIHFRGILLGEICVFGTAKCSMCICNGHYWATNDHYRYRPRRFLPNVFLSKQ